MKILKINVLISCCLLFTSLFSVYTNAQLTENIGLKWARSEESDNGTFKSPIKGKEWTYEDVFNATPLKYFEDQSIIYMSDNIVSEPDVGSDLVWDGGQYFDKYKGLNENAIYEWASWSHFGKNSNENDLGSYSLRRFTGFINFTQQQIDNMEYAVLAPQDELGALSYLLPVNDNMFVFVNGKLAYWGGTDVIEGNNQYGALFRSSFMGKKGIPVRNGVNSVFKNIYPHTDGWCIDLEQNESSLDLSSLFVEGDNTIDIIVDDFYEGGGMNKLYLYLQEKEIQEIEPIVKVVKNPFTDPYTDVWFYIEVPNNGSIYDVIIDPMISPISPRIDSGWENMGGTLRRAIGYRINENVTSVLPASSIIRIREIISDTKIKMSKYSYEFINPITDDTQEAVITLLTD